MLQLREDLILEPAHGGERYLVREPRSGAVFEFGEQEAFLIEALRKPYDPSELMAAFNARFGLNDGSDDLREFLCILADWGLLAGPAAAPGPWSDGASPAADAPRSPTKSESGAARWMATDAASFESAGVEGDESGDDESEIQRDNRWHLFRPEVLLDTLDRTLSPLRKLVWLTPLIVSYAIAGVWFNRHVVGDTLATAKLQFGLIGRLIFVTLTVNLAIQVLRGVVARHFGLRVPSFGVRLMLGLIPRFNTQIIPSPDLAKPDRLWLITTSMLVRLALFAAAVTLWLTTRASGSLLSTVGAELAFVSAVSFLFMANPFWPGDGYSFMSVALGVPNLRQRAINALRALFQGRPKVVARYSKDSLALILFAAASVAFPAAFVAFIAISAARRLESDYQGAGVAVFLVILVYVVHNALRRVRSRKKARQSPMAEALTQGEATGPRPLTRLREVQVRATELVATRTETSRQAQGKRLRYLASFALIACLFLPYSYETGGDAQIYPIAEHEIYAEMDGVTEHVAYDGGEWVTQGTVLAKMANHRQRKDVAATQAAIESKQKDIDRLRSTPSAESIRLAEQEIETARLESRYSTEDADRIEKLFKKGTVSAQEWEDAKKKRDVDAQQVEEKRAALEALEAQINPNEIASAEADLQKLREDLAYYEEQFRRTSLRMPMDGRIATTKLKNLQNTYLEEGKLFAEVEDTRQVRVEIAVPESDAFDIRKGCTVRLKTWADPGQIFLGTVVEIAPQATDETYGKVVKVTALLPNPDLALKTGMTGYAKIEAEDTLVIIAFTKAWSRFFLIEMWSWLP
jgi:putative peptide zinc metalloprotease protein